MVRFFVDSDFYITQRVSKRGTERILGIGKNISSLRRLLGACDFEVGNVDTENGLGDGVGAC